LTNIATGDRSTQRPRTSAEQSASGDSANIGGDPGGNSKRSSASGDGASDGAKGGFSCRDNSGNNSHEYQLLVNMWSMDY
jgi:hypothetical protein